MNEKTRFVSTVALHLQDIKDPCTALTARGVTDSDKEPV